MDLPGWLTPDGEGDPDGSGAIIAVRATPRAAKDAVDGALRMDDGSVWLAVRVRAVPDKGAANTAVAATLAKALGLRKSDVTLIAGATARQKRFRVAASAAVVAARRTSGA